MSNETKHIEAMAVALAAADDLRKAIGRGTVTKFHLDAYDRARAAVLDTALARAEGGS